MQRRRVIIGLVVFVLVTAALLLAAPARAEGDAVIDQEVRAYAQAICRRDWSTLSEYRRADCRSLGVTGAAPHPAGQSPEEILVRIVRRACQIADARGLDQETKARLGCSVSTGGRR